MKTARHIITTIALIIGFIYVCTINYSLGIGIFGVGMILFLLLHILKVNKIKKNGHLVKGHIVDVEFVTDGANRSIIEFQTIDGVKISGEPLNNDGLHLTILDPKRRWPVDIIYQKDNPSDFIVYRKHNLDTVGYIFFLLIALLFIIFGLCDYFIWHNLK
jgi:hypothetical protein